MWRLLCPVVCLCLDDSTVGSILAGQLRPDGVVKIGHAVAVVRSLSTDGDCDKSNWDDADVNVDAVDHDDMHCSNRTR